MSSRAERNGVEGSSQVADFSLRWFIFQRGGFLHSACAAVGMTKLGDVFGYYQKQFRPFWRRTAHRPFPTVSLTWLFFQSELFKSLCFSDFRVIRKAVIHHVGNESGCKKVTPGAPNGAPGGRGEDKEGGLVNVFGGDDVNAGSGDVG